MQIMTSDQLYLSGKKQLHLHASIPQRVVKTQSAHRIVHRATKIRCEAH